MPKRLPEDLIARIVAEIAPHPEGVGIDDLHADLGDIVRVPGLAANATAQRSMKGPSTKLGELRVKLGAPCCIIKAMRFPASACAGPSRASPAPAA